jgi:metal-sulfur cluster biosynthetic enzyme
MHAMSAEREADVWRMLERVADPELDEPITEMGFVEGVEIAGPAVEVTFRLPTYWCSPNFAFLMCEGIVREVGSLPWVARARVRLEDHMHAEEVMASVNGARDFSDAFADLCDGEDLAELREKFAEKAFQRRQEAVLLALRALGFQAEAIAEMRLRQLEFIDFEDEAERERLARYRELLTSRGLAKWPGDLAFVTWQGAPLTAAGLPEHLARLRQVRINMEFNGALCRGLKDTRYKEVARVEGEPTLVDFILGRVPPRVEVTG